MLNRPVPVPVADGSNHLSYEIEAVNQSQLDVTVGTIATWAQGRRVGLALTGSALVKRTRLNDDTTGSTTLGSGASAIFFIDATYFKKRRTQVSIRHNIAMSWLDPGNPGQTVNQRIFGVNSLVSRRTAVELSPPLRGTGWVAASSCCTLNPHRGATLAIDGTIRVPERFAIDFVRLNDQERLFDGPISDLSSYDFFGDRIHAAAAGRVVRVADGLPEQVPGALPVGATIQNAGGNHVVVDIGQGRFAFYAHLKTGSVRAKVGDRVRTGQVLGLLGNTGNTDSPYLHFHVMDSPSPLQSNGLPYTFTRFKARGIVIDQVALLAGGDPLIDPNRWDGPHRNVLARDYQIVDFPGRAD